MPVSPTLADIKVRKNEIVSRVSRRHLLNGQGKTKKQEQIVISLLTRLASLSFTGKCGIPRIGWQIDTPGDSRENAALLAQMGYDALFICKAGGDENQRYLDRTAEVKEQREVVEWRWKYTD